jgi:hypothetical protein
MLYEATEQLILPGTARLRAAIYGLLMDGALDMIIEGVQGVKLSRAEVAFVKIAIPSALRGDHLDAVVTRHGQERPCDDVIAIKAADHGVDLDPVETGCGAVAGFEMDRYARGSRETYFAEGTLHGATHVDFRVHVLELQVS